MRFSIFAKNFSAACLQAGLPTEQDNLGKLFNVSGTTVHYWRTGKKLPSLENAIAIASKTGVCVEWLYTGRGPKYPAMEGEKLNEASRQTFARLQQLPPESLAAIDRIVGLMMQNNT